MYIYMTDFSIISILFTLNKLFVGSKYELQFTYVMFDERKKKFLRIGDNKESTLLIRRHICDNRHARNCF